MNYQDWKLLATLYDTKNITRAAQTLFLSQPTLSARLKRLETYYDVQLIIRKRNGIAFTPEGLKLAEHAKKMLYQQRKIEEEINNMKDDVSGTIRVGVSNFFALNKMPKLLRYFKQKHPYIECQVVAGWSSDIYRLLLNDEVHIGIIKGNYPWKGKKEFLYEENIVVAAPWPFTWGQLPQLPRIDYHTDVEMHDLIDRWWYNNYREEPYVSIQVNQVETCREMIINQLGYAILAHLVVQTYQDLTIKTLYDSSGKPITRQTAMYYDEDILNLNIVQAFISFVRTMDVKGL